MLPQQKELQKFNMKRLLRKINSIFNGILKDVILLLQSPKDYLYSFTYPTNRFVKIRPYKPSLQTTADKIINKIHKAAPNLKVYFVGSASFHISGQGDIDLVAKSKSKNFNKYLPVLTDIFGNPSKKRSKFIEWHFMYNKYNIELLLADPTSPNFKNELKIYKILKKNKKLLKEYEAIKKSLNGLPVREYIKRRMSFFNKILEYK